ncbi:MAG TPA: Stk1 family PASTA domain-containing Ser/Thr kinase [Streptosporangiaceae bacterium]|nr:Stk1 family PASTA domain-containing Ser/Thr kinase [Streptosporangiaceae bacterium]
MTQPRLLGGRYELDGVVGRGGMAEVYRARDLRLDRIVAVKTLREDLARDQTFQARFRREAQSAASLNHPSIVAVYDTGEDNSGSSHVPFIVMEYVDGRTIRDLLRDDRRLLPERALEITDGVLRALDYSHRNGIVHRDIKPGNVMLNRQGEIKVMDFGIARATSDAQATMTQTAQVIGTAQYLSPEQARGERVDSRSDLYSVGCLLYELLTGRPPFTGDSPVAIAYQHVRENPIPPSRVDPELPGWADPIVLRAMEKDPADRYQSAAEMRSDIQRAISGYPVGAQMRQASTYAGPGGPGTRRMDPMGQTQLQGSTGAIPPFQYGQAETGGHRGERRRRPIWPWIAALVALIVIGAIVLAYETITGHGTLAGVSVPTVVGKKLSAAETALQNKGFKVRAIAHTTTTGPPNIVTSTTPAGGSVAKKGSTVQVVYNARPGAKALPDVSGLSVSEATAKLNSAGFKAVSTNQTLHASLSIPEGHVVSTTPTAGTKLSTTTPIVLNVSGGGRKVPVVTDEQLSDALAAIRGAGLVPEVIDNQPGPPGATPGTVWETKPGGGSVVLPGQTITVYVVPGSNSPSPSPSNSPSSPPPGSPPPSSPPPSPSPSGSPSPSPSD